MVTTSDRDVPSDHPDTEQHSVQALADPESQPAPRAESAAPRWRRLLSAWPTQVAASAAILGLLLHLRYGYIAGSRDHLVLSPVGMRQANPDWFAGDWTIANAPQPHWQFDLYTRIGVETGTLAALYLLYWVAALVVFGVATTLLARTWMPRHAWVAVVAVSAAAPLGPVYFLGGGTEFFATALPNVMGGLLLYLTTAALLTGRHRLAALAAPATAFGHVQHGTVAVVLVIMVAVVVLVRTRRVDWALAASIAGTLALIVFNLTIRPVAGHLSDFRDACDLLVPYHCEATSWSWGTFYGGVALVVLAQFIVLFLPRGERWRWAVVAGLPGLALVAGAFVDRFNVPALGLAAQGLNVYRLSQLLLPLFLWGALTPFFARLTPGRRWLAGGAVLLLSWYGLQLQGWALDGNTSFVAGRNQVTSVPLLLIGGFAVVAGCVVQTVPGVLPRLTWLRRLTKFGGGDADGGEERGRELAVGGAAVLLVLCLLASAVGGHTLRWTSFNPQIFPIPGLAAWGEQVQRVVPPGEQVLIPPRELELRMAMKRGVVVDCKYAPYGGEAWRGYRERIEALGGFAQCLGESEYTGPLRKLSAEELSGVAGRYGAGYIVLRTDDVESRQMATGLATLGWTVVVPGQPTAPYQVLKAA